MLTIRNRLHSKVIIMAICFGDSRGEVGCYRLSSPMSISSASTSSKTTVSTSMETPETSPLKGLENVKIQQFVGIEDMRKIVESQSDKLRAGASEQYLIFQPVTTRDLAKIDRERHNIGKDTRMTHYADTDLLIIKLMPSAKQEVAHTNFAKKVIAKMIRMGMSDDDIVTLGAARFNVPTRSSKEGDSDFKPSTLKNEGDWPTLVIESGVSE